MGGIRTHHHDSTLSIQSPARTLGPEAAGPISRPSLSGITQQAAIDPRSLSRADAAALQRTIGNAAVRRLAQRSDIHGSLRHDKQLQDAAGDAAQRRQEAAPSFGAQASMPIASPDVVQCRRIAPAVTGAATLGAQGEAASTDRGAPGPATMWSYPVTINANQADREAALIAVRTQYAAIGTGFGNNFLAAARVIALVGADGAFAERIYDIFHQADAIPAHDAIRTRAEKKVALQDQTVANRIIDLSAGTTLDLLRGQNQIESTDPTRVRIAAPYAQGENLAITAEYSEGLKGYISRVEDTGANNTNATLQDRPNYAGEFPLPDNSPYRGSAITVSEVKESSKAAATSLVPKLASFSNVHHEATVESVATQIGRLGAERSRLEQEAGLDAMTKVVAEGGRFAPVAALGRAIRNDSVFFTANQDPNAAGTYRSVEFRVLWKYWTRKFGGDYGVTAARIATALRVNPKPAWVNQVDAMPAQTGYHFNLETNAVR